MQPEKVLLKPSDIRFTQASIAKEFRAGGTCLGLYQSIRNGVTDISAVPKIRVAERNGMYYSDNNRRLYVFRALECDGTLRVIPVLEVEWGDICQRHDFTAVNGGDSVSVRGNAVRLPHSIGEIKRAHQMREECVTKEREREEERRTQRETEERKRKRILKQRKLRALEEQKRITIQQEEERVAWEMTRLSQERRSQSCEQQADITATNYRNHVNTDVHCQERNRRRLQEERNCNDASWWKWIVGGVAVASAIYWLASRGVDAHHQTLNPTTKLSRELESVITKTEILRRAMMFWELAVDV